MQKVSRPIGGFLGLELPGGDVGLRKRWGVGDRRLAFVNASSALANLLEAAQGGTVWLPAYICPEFTRAVPPARLRYYPLDADLSPKVDVLQHAVCAGDLVVAVDYFGRPPSPAFLDYVSAHSDILFVEDCAQAFDTGRPAWGDWRLYSPRKLVGVPDGGLVVACSAKAKATRLSGATAGDLDAVDLAWPQIARFEDEAEADNDVWHALNRAKEDSLPVSSQRISRLAWSILGLLDAEAIAQQRRRNFATLASHLAPWAFLRDQLPTFVPLGFPVKLPHEVRSQVREHLYRHRVFPAVHWANLPSPAGEFPDEHALSAGLLTLPCDQRYGAAEMEKVATLFLQAVG
jgi:dTDP-4-amino-4,6-dideoxygalactose transaminase